MAAYRNCYTLIEEGGDRPRVGVGKHLANAVILFVLAEGLSGVAECGDGAQDPWFGSWEKGTGPQPFQPLPRRRSRLRW